MAAAINHSQSDSIRISIDENLCKGCEICVERCPTDVFEMTGTGVDSYPTVTDIDACTDCKTCELLCPDFALEVERIDE